LFDKRKYKFDNQVTGVAGYKTDWYMQKKRKIVQVTGSGLLPETK